MFWASKVLAPAVLVLGFAGAMTAAAPDGNQPPFGGQFGKGGFQPGKGGQFGKGDDKKKDEKKDENKKVEGKKGDEKKIDEKKATGPKSDAVVDAWLKTLLEKITDPHDTVRESARGAIVAVGPPALPALQKLADGDDAAKAVAARKLIAAIGGRGPGTPAATPGRSGMPGAGLFGPGGMGFGGRGRDLAPMPRERE